MRRLRTLGVGTLLFALTAVLVPATAQAAGPAVYCLVAYGHENPGNCDPYPVIGQPPYRGKIYPTSQPYGYGEKGLLFVEGFATPSSIVTVSVTDGSLTFTRVVEAAQPLTPGDPAPRPFKADIKVTELGVHAAETGNDFGMSILTVSAFATDNLNNVSPEKSTEIDKFAVDGAVDGGGATMDIYSPVLRNLRFPPKHWCHTSSAGMGGDVPDPFPKNFGGTREGRCSDFQYDGIGAAPDLSWLMCIEATSEASQVRNNLPAPLNQPNPFRSEYCRTSTGEAPPTGEAQLSGLAEDDHAGAFGHASEIAKIEIQIKQGVLVLRTITRFSRPNSTQGHWAETLRINDFAVNWPNGPAYSIVVKATDAVGKTATASQTGITVYPW